MSLFDTFSSIGYKLTNSAGAVAPGNESNARIEKIFSYDEESMKRLNDEELDTDFRYLSANFSRNLEQAKSILGEMVARKANLPENTALFRSIMALSAYESVQNFADFSVEMKDNDYVRKGRGPKNAVVAFVGGSPSKLDAARDKFFSGPIMKTIRDKYLDPLGLNESQAYFLNLVSDYLEDENGAPREPTAEEVAKNAAFFEAELAYVAPRYIVALGKTAKEALEGKYAEWVPHPRAVEHRGDSGEVSRKMQRLRETLQKAAGSETISATILKSDDELRIVYGVVMEPETYDTDNNWTTAEEIEKAAHYWMENYQAIGHEHSYGVGSILPVESFIAPTDMQIGSSEVRKGSWVLAVKVMDEDRWEMVKSGDYTGFSIGGRAAIDESKMMNA